MQCTLQVFDLLCPEPLTDQADEFVIADGIRIERVTEPEIEVRDGATVLEDGVSVVSFGSTAPGSPITKTFTINNVGGADLTITGGSLTLPASLFLRLTPLP